MTESDTDLAQRAERRRAWLIGWALLCCYAYFFYLGGNWNVESRGAQVFALAEQHTLVIDDYPFLPPGGGDAARYQGHYYSDKLIGPSLVAAPVYWILRQTATASELRFRTAVYMALRFTNVVTNAIPSALLGALLYLFLAELGLTAQLRVWLAFAYGLGTLAFPYSTALFGHQLAAVAVAGSFILLWHQRAEWSHRRALAAGALAGFAAISDAMGLFVAALLGGYAIWLAVGQTRVPQASTCAGPVRVPQASACAGSGALPLARHLVGQERAPAQGPTGGKPRGAVIAARLAPFALPALAVFSIQLLANWSSFGNPLSFPQVYHAQAAFRARHTAGLFGIHLPQLYPLYQLTVGPWRGLFHGSPVLLLALPGFFLMAKRWRAEAILCAAAWLVALLANAGYENWTTGSAYGPRYQIVVIPLLIIALAPAAARWPPFFRLLAVVSIAFTAIVTAQTPFIPEDLRDPLPVAIAEFTRGNLLNGNLGMLIGLQGITSLAPLIAAVAAFLLALRLAREPRKQAGRTGSQ